MSGPLVGARTSGPLEDRYGSIGPYDPERLALSQRLSDEIERYASALGFGVSAGAQTPFALAGAVKYAPPHIAEAWPTWAGAKRAAQEREGYADASYLDAALEYGKGAGAAILGGLAQGAQEVPGGQGALELYDASRERAENAGISSGALFGLDVLAPGPHEILAMAGLTRPMLARMAQSARLGRMAEASPEAYVAARARAPKQEYLTHSTAEELRERGYRAFLDEDGQVGFAIDPAGDLQLFNASGIPGAGTAAMLDALDQGAQTLDAFEPFLPGLYRDRFGFEETWRATFDPEQAPAHWPAARGTPDVVGMRYAGPEPAAARAQYYETGRIEPARPGAEPERGRAGVPGEDPAGAAGEARGGLDVRAPEGAGAGLGRLPRDESHALGASVRETPSGLPAYLEEDAGALSHVPDVEQYPLERVPDPKYTAKTQDRIGRLYEPENVKRVEEGLARGIDEGGLAWYNTDPVRRSAMEALGPEAGEEAFLRFALLLGATSPRSIVRQNIRRASLGYTAWKRGAHFPDQPKVPTGEFYPDVTPKYRTTYLESLGLEGLGLPENYGHLAHNIQRPHIEAAMRGVGPDPTLQPKIASFSENLAGNYEPSTIDTHNAQQVGWIQPGKTLNESHYPLLERFNRERAAAAGIAPAQAQASIWIGLREMTGVEDPRIFMQIFNDALAETAHRRGVSQAQALNDFWRGRAPLYGIGAGAGGLTLGELLSEPDAGGDL